MAADQNWRDNLVGACPLQLSFRRQIVCPCDDVQVRVQTASREYNVDVFRIARSCRNQCACNADPGAFENRLIGCIPNQNQVASGEQPFGYRLVSLDDDEINPLFPQLVDDTHTHAPRATKDVMIFQFTNVLEQFSPPKRRSDFGLDQCLGQNRDQKAENRDPYDDQDDREDPARITQWMNLAISNRRQRDQGHVESIKPGPVFDQMIAQCSQADNGKDCSE